MHDDRRKFLRVTADFGVEVQPRSGGAPFAARTVNISAGGAKMVAEEPVALQRASSGSRSGSKGRPCWSSSMRPSFAIERSHPRWVFAVQFHGLDRYIEQRIVRWVFAEDRRAAERRAAVRVPVNVLAWCRPADGRRTVPRGDDRSRRRRDAHHHADGVGGRAIASRSSSTSTSPPTTSRPLAEIVWRDQVLDGRWTYGMRFEQVDRAIQRQIVEHALRATGGRPPPSGGGPRYAEMMMPPVRPRRR